MKSMKGFAAVLFTFVLTASLAGCGGSSSSSSSSSSDDEAQESRKVEADEADEAEAEEEEVEEEAPKSDVAVTIDNAELGTDWEGKEVVIVTYTFTNVSSDEAESFVFSCMDEVYQEGVQLEKSYFVDGLEGSSDNKVKAGTSYTLQQAYELNSHADIEVEVTEAFSWDDIVLAKATFSF